MSTSKNKKKKESIFMKSSLKVWKDKHGKICSRATGSLDQTITNYNEMITYLKTQANAMAGSAFMTLGQDGMPDCIVGVTTSNPKISGGGSSGNRSADRVHYQSMSQQLGAGGGGESNQNSPKR
jgi:hypothetical protein